jgi:hypothetical protein
MRLLLLLLAKKPELLEKLLRADSCRLEALFQLPVLPLERCRVGATARRRYGFDACLRLVRAPTPPSHLIGQSANEMLKLVERDQIRTFAV